MENDSIPRSLRRRGTKVPVDISMVPYGDFRYMVIAQFRDNNFFMFRQIKACVDTWESRGHIEVSKDNDFYYFYFQDPGDWAVFQGQYHTLNFKGGLLILRPWSLTMSYKSINFSETAIWVKVEGIPFILSTEDFTHNILSNTGGVLHMDEESLKRGPKRYMRALVWIKLSKPLVPGCYIEYEPGNMLWVDFRYEGVFRLYNKCGRIGHTMSECNKSWEMDE
ncbi:hypothetical protein RDABS01_016267 [Bienertia sinuspersici]